MKKSVILDIFNGFRGHMETMNRPKDEKENLGLDIYDELTEKLSPELFKLHQKFMDMLKKDWCRNRFLFCRGL